MLGYKNIKIYNTSARVGYTLPVWKSAQVQGLKESRLAIRGGDDLKTNSLAQVASLKCLDFFSILRPFFKRLISKGPLR